MKKQLLLLVMMLLPMIAYADKSGTCGDIGDNLTWTLVESTGTLTIEGSGAMKDYGYEYYSTAPWYGDSEKISTIVIGSGITTIGSYAFDNCSGLTSVTIGNGVTSIGERAFANCSTLQKVIVSDIAAWCGINFGNDNANPLTNAKHLYSDENTEIKDLVIPNSVTTIAYKAFYGCIGLISLTIPNSVTSIGGGAFSGCSSLQKVIVSDIAAWCGIKFGYDANPLYYAKHLYIDENTEIKDLVIPNSVTKIGDNAFYGCDGLTSITIPNSVTSIGEAAFLYCDGLTSITIPNSVTSIGEQAFRGCWGVTSITIGNGLTNIGTMVFGDCGALTSIIIPNSVTSIGNWAFVNCSSLTSVIIGNGVTSIGNYAFKSCPSLTSVTIGNNVTSIGGSAFSGCSGLTSITIPNSVTKISGLAFDNCTGLTSITIPNSVTSIGDRAFVNCSSLTSVIIGNGVTSIGERAFDGADIATIISLKENPFGINYNTFSENTYGNATLYVPTGCIEKYKNTSYWQLFAHIEEGNPTGINAVRNTPNHMTTIYDLNGVRQPKPKKGINIVNGKKVVVK